MDDRLLVRMLHAFANFDEKFETVADPESVLVAVGGDRNALYVLHDEVWLAVGSGARVEDLGDRWVVHDGEGLPLGLEPLKKRVVIHARSDEL